MRLSSFWLRCGALFGLGLLIALGFTFWRQQPAALQPPLALLPQDPLIQVYFNHSQAAFYKEPYRPQQRLGDDLEQILVEAIESATSTVDVAAHELNLPHVAAALKAKHQAGVQVRVLVENSYRRPLSQLTATEIAELDERGSSKYTNFVQLIDQNQDGQLSPAEIADRDAIVILETAGVPLKDDTADGSAGSGLMHHKFVVIDRQQVVTGSANLTWSDIHGDLTTPESQGNANHLLKINSPAVAQLFSQEFELMWGNQFGLQKAYRPPQTIALAAGSTVTVQFSPTSSRLPWNQSVNGLIGRELSRATRSADLALFVFSDQALGNLLEADRQRGVDIRALIDPGFAYRDYSEALDMMGVALPNSKCRYETNNQPWRSPIATVGIPSLPKGDLLHHKLGIVDGHRVITGSQNWSDAANSSNDETLLVIDNATVAAHFQREFDRLYQTAILGVPPHLQRKIQQQQQRCQL